MYSTACYVSTRRGTYRSGCFHLFGGGLHRRFAADEEGMQWSSAVALRRKRGVWQFTTPENGDSCSVGGGRETPEWLLSQHSTKVRCTAPLLQLAIQWGTR